MNLTRTLRLAAGASLLLLIGCGSTSPGDAGSTSSGASGPRTTGSTSTTVDDAPPPCVDNPASSSSLGSPYRGGPTALFTTDGSKLFVTARRFEHGGVFDPDRGVTMVWLGPASVEPRDEPSGAVLGATKEIALREGTFAAVELSPGRYWLWTSTGGDVLVISCVAGAVTDPVPRS